MIHKKKFARLSVENGAAEAFKAYLAQDGVQMPKESHPVYGSDEIYNIFKKESEYYILECKPQKDEAAQSGDMDWTWGKYKITY